MFYRNHSLTKEWFSFLIKDVFDSVLVQHFNFLLLLRTLVKVEKELIARIKKQLRG
jgi:hypothetical protein